MCEVLIRGITNGATGDHWQRGDIVTVQEDGHVWGREESKAAWIASGGLAAEWPGGYFLLKVPGRTAVDFAALYLAPWVDASGQITIARSAWQFRVDDLSSTELRKFEEAGEYTADTVTRKNIINSVFRNKLSQEFGSV
jgi:hypothetical protein